MPSPVGHTIGAFAAMLAVDPTIITNGRRMILSIGTAFVVGTLADADFLIAYFSTAPYLRHHYFSHSIPFAIVFTLFCWLFLKSIRFKNAGRATAVLGAAYSSHLLLDYFADDGSRPYGIPLLWPFSNRHFIAPFDIFLSIHRGEFSDLFSLHNVMAILIEVGVLAPIVLLLFLIANTRMKAAGI
jgi:membrane-bound metal-dependent hydrolase YbcI (DUF457 family)